MLTPKSLELFEVEFENMEISLFISSSQTLVLP